MLGGVREVGAQNGVFASLGRCGRGIGVGGRLAVGVRVRVTAALLSQISGRCFVDLRLPRYRLFCLQRHRTAGFSSRFTIVCF